MSSLIARVRAWVEAPLGDEPSKAELTALAEELDGLVDAAYRQQDPARLREAEELLCRLNPLCHFTQPIQALPSYVWSRLARERLRHALALVEPRELTGEELRAELASASEASAAAANRLVDTVFAQADDRALKVFTKNWFVPGQGFVEWMISIAHRTQDLVLRRAISENLAEESEGEGHMVLRDRFCEAVGVSFNLDELISDPDVAKR